MPVDEGPSSSLPFEPAGPDAAPDPSTTGPYPVGVTTLTWVDETRETEGFEGPRTLTVEVWYPAVEAARGAPGESYVLHEYLDDEQQAQIPPEALGELSTIAVRDAAPHEGEVFPVVLFSHGKGGIRMQSTFYTVDLASHGYVVVSPDHQGDTLVEQINEGDFVISSTASAFLDRPIDMSFLIEKLEEGDHPFAGRIDLERIGISGHSFGALTSFRTAGFDARIKAAVAHTPVGIGLVELALEVPVERFGIPLMIQAGGLDRTLEPELHADSLWEAMVPPRFRLDLATAGHFTWSDLCVLDLPVIEEALDLDLQGVLDDGCGPENLGTATAFPVIRHYSIGFFNAYLRDSPGSLQLLTEGAAPAVPDGELRFLREPE